MKWTESEWTMNWSLVTVVVVVENDFSVARFLCLFAWDSVEWWLYAGEGATEMEHPSYKYIHEYSDGPSWRRPKLILQPLYWYYCCCCCCCCLVFFVVVVHNTKKNTHKFIPISFVAAPWHYISIILFCSVVFAQFDDGLSDSLFVLYASLFCWIVNAM